MVLSSPRGVVATVTLGLLAVASGQRLIFDFENSMDGWTSYSGFWRWTNRNDLANTLPGSNENGFVVMDEAFRSDELYTPYFDATLGINFTMKFFLRSRWYGSSNMYVAVHEQGRPKEIFLDLQEYATPDTNYWITVTAELPPMNYPILLSVFCFNGEAAPPGDLMYGCAVDQILIDVYTDATTKTTTSTTAAATTTTAAATTTTTDATTTTTTAATTTTTTTTDATTTTTDATTTTTDDTTTTTAATTTTTTVPTQPPTDTTTHIPTDTPTDVPTDTPTDFPTDTSTDVPTDTPTDVPTDTPTDVPTDTPTDFPTDTSTDVPTDAPTDVPTDTPTDVPTDTPTDVPTDTPTDVPTDTPTDVPTDTPTDVPTYTPTDVPTDTPTDVPTDTPTDVPTDTPTDVPTDTPTDIPTDFPTDTPTDVPTDTPTDVPTDTPTDVPTDTLTDFPTDTPTDFPTDTSTDVLTDTPTDFPTDTITEVPTDNPTDFPTDTPTDAPTDTPTDLPTDTPTNVPTDTPTDFPTDTSTDFLTDTPTDFPTDTPTNVPTDTPTDFPTDTSTDFPTDTPTDFPTDTPTDVPTDTPTDVPTDTLTDVPTDTLTDVPTHNPTDVPTDTPTDIPTDPPTEGPTHTPTDAPTDTPTTEGTTGSLIFDFQSSSQGWAMNLMNAATWGRVLFDSENLPVGSPPAGPWVLHISSMNTLSGTVLAQSPELKAVSNTMNISITFWMDGDSEFPCDLKVRRTHGFNNFDEGPLVNLDAYGDQQNHYWITYSIRLVPLLIGETFSIVLEGSLGGHPNNSVVVSMVELEGVRVVPTHSSNFFDFEDGLSGWSQGNMDGGRWKLQKWSEIDPSLQVPKPSDGENFLFVERFDIHSGVITMESPSLCVATQQRKRLHIKFWVRGSVVYPAVLRMRTKSASGKYDDLPFLNLAPYGDINHPSWIQLDVDYYIPVSEHDNGFQLVLEADLGSDLYNLVAVDDLGITTEYLSH